MSYSRNEFAEHMQNWETLIKDFTFPYWEELPSFELYMDQVIVLMNKYLKNLTSAYDIQAMTVTPPMINNYVKLKAMPAPVKKRYSRIHLAYLIMICSLKQALSIPTIQKIIPLLDDEEKIKNTYEFFCHNQKKAFEYIVYHIKEVSGTVLSDARDNPDRLNDLAVQIAISANLFKILTEDMASINESETATKK